MLEKAVISKLLEMPLEVAIMSGSWEGDEARRVREFVDVLTSSVAQSIPDGADEGEYAERFIDGVLMCANSENTAFITVSAEEETELMDSGILDGFEDSWDREIAMRYLHEEAEYFDLDLTDTRKAAEAVAACLDGYHAGDTCCIGGDCSLLFNDEDGYVPVEPTERELDKIGAGYGVRSWRYA